MSTCHPAITAVITEYPNCSFELTQTLCRRISTVQQTKTQLVFISHRLQWFAEHGARGKDVKLLSTQLDEERANRKEDAEAFRGVSPYVRVIIQLTVTTTGHAAQGGLLITPLHLHVLLDLARQKVLEHVDYAS